MIMKGFGMAQNGPDAPGGLDARGRKLWSEMIAERELGPADLVLLEEACRIADRLQVLDELIAENQAHYSDMLKFLAESRQQSGALRALLGDVRRDAASSDDTSRPEVTGVSDLTARIAERRQQAEG
jgi:hypothetical protein